MLTKTFDIIHSVKNRISDTLYETPPLEVLEKLQELWVRYKPREITDNFCIGSVDSGYNWLELRGYYIYVLNAGYIDNCSGKLEYAEIDIRELTEDPREYLDLRSIRSELMIINKALELSNDIVLVDGSLIKKLIMLNKYLRETDLKIAEEMRSLVKEFAKKDVSRVVFLSKNSGSQNISKNLARDINKPDIILLEEYTSEIGFALGGRASLEIFDEKFDVHFSYIRIETKSPVLRIEYLVDDEMSFIKRLIDILHTTSFNGYPAMLSLIDKLVRVSDEDLIKVVNMLSIDSYRERIRLR